MTVGRPLAIFRNDGIESLVTSSFDANGRGGSARVCIELLARMTECHLCGVMTSQIPIVSFWIAGMVGNFAETHLAYAF